MVPGFSHSRLPWLVWVAGVYDCWVSKVALVTNTATSAFSNILFYFGVRAHPAIPTGRQYTWKCTSAQGKRGGHTHNNFECGAWCFNQAGQHPGPTVDGTKMKNFFDRLQMIQFAKLTG